MLGVQPLEVYDSVRFVKGSMCFRGVPNFSAQNWRFEPTYNNGANTWQMEKRRKVFVQVIAASWELNVFSSMSYLDTSRQKPSPRILLGQTALHFPLALQERQFLRLAVQRLHSEELQGTETCRSDPELSGNGIRNAGVFLKACYQEGTAACCWPFIIAFGTAFLAYYCATGFVRVEKRRLPKPETPKLKT